MEKLIFHLKETSGEPDVKDLELGKCFYVNNPYWAQPGIPLDITNFTRVEAIDILKNELCNGYSLSGDTITAINPGLYLNKLVQHLGTVSGKCLKANYPLGWWKKDVCMYGGILIYYNEELMTLNEFMLYAISKKNEGISTYYIGSIFEYC